MSENLQISTTLTARDEASPVIRKLLANVQRLERGVKKFNSAFGASPDAGTAFGNWSKVSDRLNRSLKAPAWGANDYGRDWQRNHEARLRGEQRLHASVLRMDQIAFNRRMSQHAAITRQQSSLTHREPAPSRMTGGSRYGISPVRTAVVGGIASAGIASVFKRRMETDTAEVKARIFGELSKDDIKQSRRWIDKDSIKYGVSSGKIVDAFTESLKAGFSRDAAQQIAQGALKAQSAVELDIGQLIKLSGKTATIFGGDVKNTDPARVLKLMNAIAVASAETAADPDEVIEGFKKGNAALAMSKMSEADLAAILSVGISGGIQPSKAGNAVSNLVSSLVGGKSARGQKAKDLNEAARMLGYGGKNNLSDRMTNDPTNVLVEMFQRLNALSEQNKTKVARMLGGSEWDDEILMLAKPVDQIIATLRAVKSKVDMLDKSSAEKLNSLQGRWSSISAAFGLGLEKFGAGFEDLFIEVSDWFRSKIDKLDFDSIRRNSKQLVDGLKAAFGIADIKQSLDSMLSKIQSTNVTKVIDFAAGVASGIKSVADGFVTAIRSIASVMGKDGNDTAVLGKLTGQIIGLSVALGLLAPVLSVLAGLVGIIRVAALLLGAGTAARIGARTALGVAAGPAAGMALLGDGRPSNSASDITALQDAIKIERERKRLLKAAGKGDGRADPLFQPTSLRSDVSEKFDRMGAKLERIAFQGGGITDFSSRNRIGGSIQNADGGGSSGGTGKLLSGVGTPSALMNSTPGGALPSFGVGRSGSIINRDNIPSFNGGGGRASGPFVTGSGFRAKAPQIMQRLMDDFGLSKEQSAGVLGNLGHETGGFRLHQEKNPVGGGRGGIGWAQWTGPRRREYEAWSAAKGLDPKSDEANYGFLKHELSGKYAGSILAVKRETTASGAMRSFEKTFEKAGVKAWGSRENYTNQALGAFNNPAGEAMKPPAGVSSSFKGADIIKGVDPRIQEIVNAGAGHLPEGYKLKMTSGFRGHGAANHNGNAADYQIIGPDGKALRNRGDDPTGMYQNLARHSYGEMMARYPHLKGKFAWGGAFGTQSGGGGERDLMHFDTNGERGRHSQYLLKNLGSVPGAKYGPRAPVTSGVPSPADTTKNVPPVFAPGGDASLGGLGRGGSTININGGSHDAESLATMVQRRVDDSMQWRTHDTESEYT